MPDRPRVLDLTHARLRRSKPNPNSPQAFCRMLAEIGGIMYTPLNGRETRRRYQALARRYGGLDLDLLHALVVAAEQLSINFIRCGQEKTR